jgi:prepilin-type N-terminal cleavage/methylation domain-containing protein
MDGNKMNNQNPEHTGNHILPLAETHSMSNHNKGQKKLQPLWFFIPRSINGFSLVEVMIALVVLLLGMLGVMGMQYYAVTGNTQSRELRTATNLSHELIEQLKSTTYTSLVSGSDAPLPTAETTISGGVTYARRWWIVPNCIALNLTGDNNSCAALASTCATNPDPAVIVAVSAIRSRTCWNDKNGNIHSATLDSVRWNENVVP